MTQWLRVCDVGDIDKEDVIAVKLDGAQYAVYRSPRDEYYATDAMCTHEKTPLADGLVMGYVIECPKHNGRFDYRTGAGKGAPICVNLTTYPVRVADGVVYVDVDQDGRSVGTGPERALGDGL